MPKQRLNSTQGEWVKRQLLAGKALAHPDLVKACGGRGGWRLGAHIHRLRRDGWPIESRPMANPGPDTGLNPPVSYQLLAGWKPCDPIQLGLPL